MYYLSKIAICKLKMVLYKSYKHHDYIINLFQHVSEYKYNVNIFLACADFPSRTS